MRRQQEFLGIINSEADRMAFLVRDLLQLTRFDNKQVRLDITKIEMNEFLSMTVRQNKIHAEAKHQTLTLSRMSMRWLFSVTETAWGRW